MHNFDLCTNIPKKNCAQKHKEIGDGNCAQTLTDHRCAQNVAQIFAKKKLCTNRLQQKFHAQIFVHSPIVHRKIYKRRQNLNKSRTEQKKKNER